MNKDNLTAGERALRLSLLSDDEPAVEDLVEAARNAASTLTSLVAFGFFKGRPDALRIASEAAGQVYVALGAITAEEELES